VVWVPFLLIGILFTAAILAITSHIDAESCGRSLDALGVGLILIGEPRSSPRHAGRAPPSR